MCCGGDAVVVYWIDSCIYCLWCIDAVTVRSFLVIDSINLIVTLYRWFFDNGLHFLSYCVLYLCIVDSLRIVYLSNSDNESLSLLSIISISFCDYFGFLLVLLRLYVYSSQRVVYSDDKVVVCCSCSSCINCWWYVCFFAVSYRFVFDIVYYLTSVFLRFFFMFLYINISLIIVFLCGDRVIVLWW